MYPIKAIVLAIVIKCVSSRPDGAPPVSCTSMRPEHYNPVLGDLSETQSRPSPYTFTAKWDRHLRMVRVSVGGDRNNQIQGFLIQGRYDINQPAIGSFINITENPIVNYQDCSLLPKFDPKSSVTHADISKKESLVFYWKPPKTMNTTKNVTFYATLAKNKNTFWVMEKSEPLRLSALGDDAKPTATKSSNLVSPSEEVGENGKTTTTRAPSKVVTKTTTKKVMSSTTTTKSKGPDPASFSISLINTLLVIAFTMSLAI